MSITRSSLPKPLEVLRKPLVADLKHRFNYTSSHPLLLVSIEYQKLFVLYNKIVNNQYLISTSTLGIGNQSGSNQTPLGIHRICEKFGDNAEVGSIFKARINTGTIATILTRSYEVSSADNITSRILRLTGLEEGVNKGGSIDSYERYIYIHGTDEEGRLGTPASHGCIRMANTDVIELFNMTPVDSLLVILA